MIQIKKNDYVQPTEAREEVVQAICDAFMSTYSGIYHPFRQSIYREATIYAVTNKGTCPFFSSSNESYWTGAKCYRIRGVEMKRAFEELIKAGYYMMKVYEYGTWMGYKCSKQPFDNFHNGSVCVTSFDDRID